jgi:two-component system, chemotaxis family, chemotaxis protein CheY
MDKTMLSRLKIVVADDAYMAALTAGMLRNLGIRHIVETSDVSSTWSALKREPTGLLLIDDGLGPVDPLSLVRELRADSSAVNRHVPVLMTFLNADKNRILAARDAGVTEFLKKPLSANVIGLRLVQALENPRPFVESTVYAGPDRRRREAGAQGPERRKRKPPAQQAAGNE